MHLYDRMDSTTEEVLKLVEILAEEEDMKVTAFGTAKGLAILVAGALAGVAIVEPLAWGLFLGLIAGASVASLICWDKKSVAEVIANMPRDRQVRLVEQILKTGFALGKLAPKILLMDSPTPPHSTDDAPRGAARGASRGAALEATREAAQEADPDTNDEKTITLSDGRVVSRRELLRALKEVLAKQEGISISE